MVKDYKFNTGNAKLDELLRINGQLEVEKRTLDASSKIVDNYLEERRAAGIKGQRLLHNWNKKLGKLEKMTIVPSMVVGGAATGLTTYKLIRHSQKKKGNKKNKK